MVETRNKAQSVIMAGLVRVNQLRVDKPGLAVPENAVIDITPGEKYVSRGGLKLEKALQVFGLNVAGLTCLDVGASTGGFTDCLLQQGAQHVYALDVGYGQLDYRLREDPRVTALERTHIARWEGAPGIGFGCIDVSFISLNKVLPHVVKHVNGPIVALIKPQFEYRDYFPAKGFKGVVKAADAHQAILTGVLAKPCGRVPVGLTYSPVVGGKGNMEFLVHYAQDGVPIALEAVAQVVTEAHRHLRVEIS